MKECFLFILVTFLFLSCGRQGSQELTCRYTQFALGEIKPQGWLLETLQRQRDGLTSKMDSIYPQVMGERNGWLGGDGDQWERGPYWIDGLLPLAYILEDKALIAKVQPWIEWSLASQKEDGFFGPDTDYPGEPGLQRNNSRDWWPRMVILKIMRQYHEATGDERVIDFLTRYFHYQLDALDEHPLGTWTFWAEFRQCDNQSVVLWLYSKTHDPKLLELARKLHSQGFDFEKYFAEDRGAQNQATIHCVNLAQGMKEPVIFYQMDPDPKHIEAVKTGLEDIRRFHGFPNGMYGGDEALHGNNPTQGSELCSAVEIMLSMEEMMRITGDVQFAEHLEKVAFNALPTQITDDFMAKQYYQQVNQVVIRSEQNHNFDCLQDGTGLDYGILSGYPCCLSNFHQGWPKFIQNLWLRTADGGAAILAYGPSRLSAELGGKKVTLTETTDYPMSSDIRIDVSMEGDTEAVFPIELRIPTWTRDAVVSVNGEAQPAPESGSVIRINRAWKDGDSLELTFPMHVETERWYERSMSVSRGPLLYALRIEEEWCRHEYPKGSPHGEFCWEVYPKSDWNYALENPEGLDLDEVFQFKVDSTKVGNLHPWTLETVPVSLEAKARKLPWWEIYKWEAGPLPFSPVFGIFSPCPVETVTLVPYGSTTLRIAEFPVAWRY